MTEEKQVLRGEWEQVPRPTYSDMPVQSFDRRDRLIALEKIAQEKWEQNKSFEVDAPEPGDPLQEKFMVTFPFPCT